MKFDRLPPPLRKLVLYALCGGSGAAVDLATYTLLTSVAGVWYQLANICGYAIGTTLSFFLNRAITFGVYDAPVRRFVSFAGVAVVGWAASSSALWLMVEQLGVDKVVAKIVALVLVIAIQFTLNLLITFRRSARAQSGAGVQP